MANTNNQNNLILSPSPHFTSKIKTKNLMYMVIIALLPECVYGVILFGLSALITILTSVATAVLAEALFNIITKREQTIQNGSAIITGILLALTLPPTIPIWQTVLGALFAIIVAKAFFGGLGSNIWNPALSGRAFLFVSFPVAMGSAWIKPTQNFLSDAITSATVLPSIKSGDFSANVATYLQYFFGNRAGCIGESSILLILISFIFLLVTKVIDFRAPLAMVLTFGLCTFFSGADVLMSLLSGGLIFGATFMVTDYTTAPVTKPGRFVFGAGCGLITFLIRKFGGYPEGVMFSILIMNSIVPFLNKLTTRKYGYGKKSPKKGGVK